jgi:formylglycine-generating enzyme required for sulfatase activity
MLKKLKKILSLFFVVVLACIIVPAPGLASEKVFSNALGMEFVLIPAGTFIMGSPQDEPHRSKSEVQHPVTITRPFYMQTTEVTLKQWWAIMGKRFFGRRKGPDDMPVTKVSWHDCMKFIKKLNAQKEGIYRLPTEAEWEYACRAGSTTTYSWGNRMDCSRAMYGNNSNKSRKCLEHVKSREMAVDGSAPVKSYPPNAWGLYDMHGNVWEWCIHWHGDYPARPVTDPIGPVSGTRKIRRGGSWFGDGYSCRSANRNVGHPASRYRTTGFRLVRTEPGDLIGKKEERDWILREEEREDGP